MLRRINVLRKFWKHSGDSDDQLAWVGIANVCKHIVSVRAPQHYRLMGVGMKVAPRIVGQRNAEVIKATIDAEIIKILEELSEDAVYAEVRAQTGAAEA
jgi:hypothetical protein